MPNFVLAPDAIEDLDQIWNYIGRDSVENAERVEQAILRSCHNISKSPLAGFQRPEITTLNVRFWIVPEYARYLIVYRPDTKPLQVLRVLGPGQDVATQLTQR